jgi:hypothetical protein
MQVISLVTGNMAPCLAMNVQQIWLTSKNLQVVTTFLKFTDYWKKYMLFSLNFACKGTLLPILKQGFQSGPVPGTFTRLRSCIVPVEITEPPKISGGQNHKYDGR